MVVSPESESQLVVGSCEVNLATYFGKVRKYKTFPLSNVQIIQSASITVAFTTRDLIDKKRKSEMHDDKLLKEKFLQAFGSGVELDAMEGSEAALHNEVCDAFNVIEQDVLAEGDQSSDKEEAVAPIEQPITSQEEKIQEDLKVNEEESKPLETEKVKPAGIKSLLKKKTIDWSDEARSLKRQVTWHEDVVDYVKKDEEEEVESFRDQLSALSRKRRTNISL